MDTHVQNAPAAKPAAASFGESFAAFVTDDESRRVATAAASELGFTGATIVDGGIAGAINSLNGVATPKILLIDISEAEDPFGQLDQLADVCLDQTRVIAVGSSNDVDLFRKLIRAGVDDYLVKPLSVEPIKQAISALGDRRVVEPPRDGLGRLIIVLGVRGGIGATSVATNLAWLLAHEGRQKSVLVDLDLHFGAASLAFDVEPSRGLIEALDSPDRIDDLFVERAAIKVDDWLSVLSAEEGLDRASRNAAAAIDVLIKQLRARYKCVVVDLPRSLLANNLDLVTAGDAIVVVTDYTLLAARDSLRVLSRLREASVRAKVIPVGNVVRPAGESDVARADLEKMIGTKLTVEIPYDPKALRASAERSKPLVAAAARSPACIAFRNLAREIVPDSKPVKPSLWNRLIARGK